MYKYRRIFVSAVAILLALLMVGGVVLSAIAASSSEIKSRIEALKKQEQEIAAQQKEIQNQRAENESDIRDLVEQKNQIDQQIKLTQDSIENKNEQIQEYNLLIAEKQNELDDAIAQREELNKKYQARLRSMQENGKLTFWSILFKANSFADLLQRVDTINEIAQSDAKMLDKLTQAAQDIEAARQDLAEQKTGLEEAKAALSTEEENLAAQRAESDQLFAELMADHDTLVAAESKYESQKEDLLAQIAQQEVAYRDAVAAEEKARREAEAAAKAKAAAEAAAAKARQEAAAGKTSGSGSSSGSSSSGGSGSSSFTVSSYGFQWPCTARCITCPFGPRIHPITGKYSNHSGMDIGANYGQPIYACASGTVTTAKFGEAYGYHVVINHGNGFSTLYGHMIRYTVKVGDYVTRGEIIGYVGSTGWSTAPHLHLTMYYNGSLVNPLNYLPAGGYFV